MHTHTHTHTHTFRSRHPHLQQNKAARVNSAHTKNNPTANWFRAGTKKGQKHLKSVKKNTHTHTHTHTQKKNPEKTTTFTLQKHMCTHM